MNKPIREEELSSLWYAQAMEQLVEVVQRLSLARDLPTVMEIVRHAARQLTGADGATFVLKDNDKCYYAEEDAISPLWKGQRFPLSACISGWAMIHRQPAVIEDIYADARIPADAYRPTFVKSLAMVPIRTLDPVGAIGNYWATQRQPKPEEVKVLQALADVTAVAMENVRVYEELEQRILQRTSELQSILDNVQVGIVFAVGGKVISANPRAMEILRCASLETVSTALQTLLCNVTDGPSLADVSWKYLTKEGVFRTECHMLREGGEEFWARLIVKSIDATGDLNSEIWVIDDISEAKAKEMILRELKVAAEHANRAKDSFLATMSHEIRTPLTGMLGMMELLSLTQLDGEQRETLDAAWDSGRGLLRIVNDILDWSKIEEGKMELAPRPASVQQMLQDVVNTYSRVASAKSLVLWQHADARLNKAYVVDALRLSQVLNNFVSNAIKFTSHGEIEMRAELVERLGKSDRIRFSVKDMGVGIPPEVQERLFQRYQQESADTARMYGGTGLGLAICRRLAEMLDGHVELQSEPDKGSTFSIILALPASEAKPENVSSEHPEVKQRDVKPLVARGANAPCVLAVDDHPINRDLLARQIRLLGLAAETAENGKVALERWKTGRFALVITDCHMPEMDGYALARAMRSAEAEQGLQRTPVVAWTANALAEESGNCRAAGMDDLLVKPADMARLRSLLMKWLPALAQPGAEPPDDAGNGPPIDYSVLDMVVEGRAEQAEVLDDFLASLREDHAHLVDLLEQGECADVQSLAHRMKGSCRMVGAKPLECACEHMEQAARKRDMDRLRAGRASMGHALAELESHLGGSSLPGDPP